MSITIRNTQRVLQLCMASVQSDLHQLLKYSNHSSWDLGLHFTSDRTIRRLNKEYRQTDKPTDILSFPFHTVLPIFR